MIIGKLGEATEEKYLPEPLQIGLQALRNQDWMEMPPGRHEVRGEDIFILLSDYETEEWERRKPESHNDYLDIQYVVDGRERIGWSIMADTCTVEEDCRPERDLVYYRSVGNETLVLMEQGMFAILFPEDVHRPGCTVLDTEKVRKAVVKIRLSLLK